MEVDIVEDGDNRLAVQILTHTDRKRARESRFVFNALFAGFVVQQNRFGSYFCVFQSFDALFYIFQKELDAGVVRILLKEFSHQFQPVIEVHLDVARNIAVGFVNAVMLANQGNEEVPVVAEQYVVLVFFAPTVSIVGFQIQAQALRQGVGNGDAGYDVFLDITAKFVGQLLDALPVFFRCFYVDIHAW